MLYIMYSQPLANRYSCSVGVCCHYDLHITSQCGEQGRVMGIAWLKAARVLGGFFVFD